VLTIFVKHHEAGAKGIAVRYNKFDVENSYPSSRFSCSMLRILELSQYICLNVHNMFAYIRTIPTHMIECVKQVCTCNATRGWRQSGSQYSTIIFILKAIILQAGAPVAYYMHLNTYHGMCTTCLHLFATHHEAGGQMGSHERREDHSTVQQFGFQKFLSFKTVLR
jgi:hypothetical protein